VSCRLSLQTFYGSVELERQSKRQALPGFSFITNRETVIPISMRWNIGTW